MNATEILANKANDLITVDKHCTVRFALELMVAKKIGAILVTSEKQIIGIYTERDLMRDVLRAEFSIDTAIIGEYMKSSLHSAQAKDTLYNLMDMILGLKVRHLPVKQGDNYIGLISAGDVMKAHLQEKTRELNELNAIVSWRYYEDWRPLSK